MCGLCDAYAEPMTPLTTREQLAWDLYCEHVNLAAKDFWHELSDGAKAQWLAEADKQLSP
jgi:hypothetical protein